MKGRAAFTFVCSPFGLAGLGLIWECSSRKDWDETGQQHVSVRAYPSVAPKCSLSLQRALRWGTRRRVVLVDEAFSNIALKVCPLGPSPSPRAGGRLAGPAAGRVM